MPPQDPRRPWGSVAPATAYPRADTFRGMLNPLQYGKMRPPVLHATPERKTERPPDAQPRDEELTYDTPEKLEDRSSTSLRALSPKLPTPRDRASVKNRTPKPPRTPNAQELPPTPPSAVAKSPAERPPLKELPLVKRQARNPFRFETEAPSELTAANLWDVSVLMPPLSLDVLPAVEEIAPALRNALRFLSYNRCPEVDMSDVDFVLPPADAKTKLTVVLDLDETLMHCQKKGVPEDPPDLCLHFTDSSTTGYVRFRPHAYYFIKTLASWEACEVVVFTASTQAYADAVLNVLDERGILINHRLYRPQCVHANGGYFKDLRSLGRPLGSTVLVDNSPVSLATNPDNGIPIKSWMSDNDDRELMDLLPFIYDLMTSGRSVQPILEDRYRLGQFLEELHME